MTDNIDIRLEAARARLESQIEAARATRDALGRNVEELRSIESTARSSVGDCEVTANAQGAIIRVKLASRIRDSQALEVLLVETIAQAQQFARDAAARRAASLFGDLSPLVMQLRSDGQAEA